MILTRDPWQPRQIPWPDKRSDTKELRATYHDTHIEAMVSLIFAVILYVAIKCIYFPNYENGGSIMVVRTNIYPDSFLIASNIVALWDFHSFFSMSAKSLKWGNGPISPVRRAEWESQRGPQEPVFPLPFLLSVCLNEAREKDCPQHISFWTPTQKWKKKKLP